MAYRRNILDTTPLSNYCFFIFSYNPIHLFLKNAGTKIGIFVKGEYPGKAGFYSGTKWPIEAVMKYVIVGNGIGGVSTVEAIRRYDTQYERLLIASGAVPSP